MLVPIHPWSGAQHLWVRRTCVHCTPVWWSTLHEVVLGSVVTRRGDVDRGHGSLGGVFGEDESYDLYWSSGDFRPGGVGGGWLLGLEFLFSPLATTFYSAGAES